MVYSRETAQKIYEKLQQKGWNFYLGNHIHTLGLLPAIGRGPSLTLELNIAIYRSKISLVRQTT
ncbi:MAG: hypothetical protein WC595_06075 [Candidatus Nanoarchaeia archaeon]